MSKDQNVRIIGLYSWHDGGYCVFENGKIVEHIEIERYNRIKGSHGNSFKYVQEKYLKKNNLSIEDIDHWVSVSPDTNLEAAGKLRFSVYDKLPKEKINQSIELSMNILKEKKFENIKILDLRQNSLIIINE